MNEHNLDIRRPSQRLSSFARAALAGSVVTLTLLAMPSAGLAAGNATQGGSAQVDRGRQADAGPVLRAQVRPFGYSLDSMAQLLASFNTTDRSGPPPNSPFQVLYQNAVTGAADFTVAAGTFLYVPVLFSDNAPPVIGHFPADAENRGRALHYWFSQSELGVVTMQVLIDGKATSLGAGYLSGVSTVQPLADGATQYLTAAAFIAPLSRGTHTVEIRAKATGDALREPPVSQYFPDGVWEFSITYVVSVK